MTFQDWWDGGFHRGEFGCGTPRHKRGARVKPAGLEQLLEGPVWAWRVGSAHATSSFRRDVRPDTAVHKTALQHQQMKLDQTLVDAASQLIRERFGDSGWGGAAAVYTATGRVLTSVSVEALLDAANLCIETGAIAEAHKLNEPITASVCLVRLDSEAPRVVTACGVCQERLRFWGPDVEVAIPDDELPGWRAEPLSHLQPFWWGAQFGAI